jgi:hypothetical protein
MEDNTLSIIFLLWVAASWVTHIVVCLQTEAWGFLIGGAIFVPIAWIHGTGVWFGVW